MLDVQLLFSRCEGLGQVVRGVVEEEMEQDRPLCLVAAADVFESLCAGQRRLCIGSETRAASERNEGWTVRLTALDQRFDVVLELQGKGHGDHRSDICGARSKPPTTSMGVLTETYNYRFGDAQILVIERMHVPRHSHFIVPSLRMARIARAAIINGDHPVASVGEGLHHTSPGIPCLRVPVYQDHGSTVRPVLGGVDVDVVQFHAWGHFGRMVFPV